MQIRARLIALYNFLEHVITFVLLILLMLVVLNGTWQFTVEIMTRLWHVVQGHPLPQESALEFLKKLAMLRQVFGAFLLILIGVELMRTVVTYLESHELHVEVVFTVAMIAIARHAIDVDIEHVEPLTLLGMGGLIVALTGGYYIFRRAIGGTGS